MNPSDANKFLRWSIPGWVSILSAIIFVSVDVISSTDNMVKLFPTIKDLIINIGNGDELANILIVALAGFPLGYLIYQFYFFVRWNSPFSRNGLFPPFIVGREVDLNRILRKIDLEKLNITKMEWRKDWITNDAFLNDHSFRWQYIESLFTEIVQKIDSQYQGVKIYERYRYLLDLMHTLGASIAGMYLGFFLYLIIKMRKEALPLTTFAVFSCFALFFLLISLDIEDRYRHIEQELDTIPDGKKKKDAVIVLKGFGKELFINFPSIMYLLIFGMVIFFVSPSLIANQDHFLSPNYIWRVGFVIILIIFSKFLRWGSSKEEEWSLGIVLFIGLAISLLLRFHFEGFINTLDWSFINSLYIFLVMNLVFLKNRQNSRDDLIALQYYTLQRCIEEEGCINPIDK